MRHYALLIPLLLLANCGQTKQEKPGLTGSTPNPSPASTPSPSSIPTSQFKWSDSVLSEQTNSCAARGSSSYTVSQWKVFCRCAYEEAALRWTFDEFLNGFEENFNELVTLGKIDYCLSKAGMD